MSDVRPNASQIIDLHRRPDRQLARYNAPALEKGLDILELLASSPTGLTQQDIARELNRTVSEIFRMLATLERRGYISQYGGDDRYVLTLLLFRLSHQYPPTRLLIQEALPPMRALTRQVDQSCHLAIFHQGQALIVAQVDAPGAHSYNVRMGAQVPVFEASSGMVLLAFQTDPVRRHMMDQCPDFDAAAQADLDAHLARIRAAGFEDRPSYQVRGIYNLSCPVLDYSGSAVAAMTVPFVERIGARDGERARTLGVLTHAAAETSLAIGGRGVGGSPASPEATP